MIETEKLNGYISSDNIILGDLAEKGDPGKNSFLHIKYSVKEPTQDSDVSDTINNWIGIYVDDIEESSNEFQKYDWVNIKGEQGLQGEQGPQGEQGLQGKGLQFIWDGTKLGIRVEGQEEYNFVDLKGDKGDKGNAGIITDEQKQYIETSILQKQNPIGHIRFETTNINPNTYLGFGTWVLWGTGRVPVGVNTNDTSFNTVEKTGGEKTHTLTKTEMPLHTHTIPAHSHGLNNHTHSIPVLSGTANLNGSHRHTVGADNDGTYRSAGTCWSVHDNTPDGAGKSAYTSYAGDHTHTVTTTASTTGTASGSTANSDILISGNVGSDNAHNNLQPYITCYMWKRTA